LFVFAGYYRQQLEASISERVGDDREGEKLFALRGSFGQPVSVEWSWPVMIFLLLFSIKSWHSGSSLETI
jgi:hypothetical protein